MSSDPTQTVIQSDSDTPRRSPKLDDIYQQLGLPPQPAPPVNPSVKPDIAGYELFEQLARGGMGIVFRGRQLGTNREVAVKLCDPEGKADTRQLIRFLAEAESAAAVKHDNVVQVFEFGHSGGRPFLALEYCPGGTLEHRVQAAPLPPHEAAGLFVQIAAGVQAVHDQGIVHRDLKPANILFAADGTPKVADFGLAKRGTGSDLTRTKAIMGTPAYMSPEQAKGDTKFVGPGADVWAVGAMFYECLTGARPFRAADQWDLLRMVINDPPLPLRQRVPTLPKELETICLKCLSKEPHDRYPTAQAVADDLSNWLSGKPIGAKPAGGSVSLLRAGRWAVRHRVAAAGIAAGLAGWGALAAALGYAAGRMGP